MTHTHVRAARQKAEPWNTSTETEDIHLMMRKYAGSKVPERKNESIKIIPNRVTKLLQVPEADYFHHFRYIMKS